MHQLSLRHYAGPCGAANCRRHAGCPRSPVLRHSSASLLRTAQDCSAEARYQRGAASLQLPSGRPPRYRHAVPMGLQPADPGLSDGEEGCGHTYVQLTYSVIIYAVHGKPFMS